MEMWQTLMIISLPFIGLFIIGFFEAIKAQQFSLRVKN